nr:MAG TPA: hypothetical protein [Caudoviricetes sp.]
MVKLTIYSGCRFESGMCLLGRVLSYYNMNWITMIIYLVHKLCYLKRGKW